MVQIVEKDRRRDELQALVTDLYLVEQYIKRGELFDAYDTAKRARLLAVRLRDAV